MSQDQKWTTVWVADKSAVTNTTNGAASTVEYAWCYWCSKNSSACAENRNCSYCMNLRKYRK